MYRSFKHFTFFIHEFDLIDKKELAPMAELIEMNLVSCTHTNTHTHTHTHSAHIYTPCYDCVRIAPRV